MSIEIKVNPLIVELTKAGKDEELTRLDGYVGRSDAHSIRLYGNLELTYYVDIPRDDILHCKDHPKGDDGMVQLFLRKDTNVYLSRSCSKKPISVFAKQIHPNLPDLDFCLVECALDHSTGSDAYETCATTCETSHPITARGSSGLFALK